MWTSGSLCHNYPSSQEKGFSSCCCLLNSLLLCTLFPWPTCLSKSWIPLSHLAVAPHWLKCALRTFPRSYWQWSSGISRVGKGGKCPMASCFWGQCHLPCHPCPHLGAFEGLGRQCVSSVALHFWGLQKEFRGSGRQHAASMAQEKRPPPQITEVQIFWPSKDLRKHLMGQDGEFV